MMRKSLGLAAVVLGCSLGVAAAQTMEPPTVSQGNAGQLRASEQLRVEETLQVLHALAQQHALTPGYKAGAPATGSRASTSNLNAMLPIGFNVMHATNCGWSTDGLGNQFFVVFPQEGGIVFEVNNQDIAHGLMVPCANGNLFGINVIDTAGNYNLTFSFPFQ